MNCPVCKETKLVITERQGIEIDYCPDCRGVWLDRGELDKLIERSAPAPQTNREPERERYREREHKHHDDRDDYKYDYKKKKKEGFLGEFFDF